MRQFGIAVVVMTALFPSLLSRASAQTVVPTPDLIETLTPAVAVYTPEIEILSPQEGETLATTSVPLEFNVKRFPVAQDPATELGLHLKVIVDNQAPITHFDVEEPLLLNLNPGTHTIRVIAVRPWGEAYRNLPAFAHVTFNVVEADDENAPKFEVGTGLITVVSPSGSYGAEPILVDYLVDGVNLGGAQVRYTLNGESELTTDRGPLYLTGWQPGQNELVLELVNRDGNLLENAGYTRVERTITFEPGGEDALSQLVRGELTPEEMAGALGPKPFIYDDQGKVVPLN
jgi:hypothetical protein